MKRAGSASVARDRRSVACGAHRGVLAAKGLRIEPGAMRIEPAPTLGGVAAETVPLRVTGDAALQILAGSLAVIQEELRLGVVVARSPQAIGGAEAGDAPASTKRGADRPEMRGIVRDCDRDDGEVTIESNGTKYDLKLAPAALRAIQVGDQVAVTIHKSGARGSTQYGDVKSPAVGSICAPSAGRFTQPANSGSRSTSLMPSSVCTSAASVATPCT